MESLLAGLRAAAEPTRLRLLAACAAGELTVSEITQIVGQSQPRVSRHLKLLCEAGLLDRFREGTWVFYRLARQGEGGALARQLLALLPADDAVLAGDARRLAEIQQARAAAAARYFSTNAAEWDRLRVLHVDEAEVERALLEAARPLAGAAVLDIGTGTGRVLELLGREAGEGVGVDTSREMLALARARLQQAGLTACTARQGDMYQLPFADGSFDVVTIHQVLHYADRPAAAIAEAARVLRAQGRLVVVDFAPHELETLRDAHAHRRLGFDSDTIFRWFAEAGLAPAAENRLPGDPLTVMVWRGDRRHPQAAAAA